MPPALHYVYKPAHAAVHSGKYGDLLSTRSAANICSRLTAVKMLFLPVPSKWQGLLCLLLLVYMNVTRRQKSDVALRSIQIDMCSVQCAVRRIYENCNMAALGPKLALCRPIGLLIYVVVHRVSMNFEGMCGPFVDVIGARPRQDKWLIYYIVLRQQPSKYKPCVPTYCC